MNKKWLFSLSFMCGLTQAAVFPIPDGMSAVKAVEGDLDGDGVPELVVAYNIGTDYSAEEKLPRSLIIFKKDSKENWQQMVRSDHALFGKRLKTDPLNNLEINKGELKIYQKDGSSFATTATADTYRYQNGDFYLIEHGFFQILPCNESMDVFINFVTQKMVVKKRVEECTTVVDGDSAHERTDSIEGDEKTYSIENYEIPLQYRRITKVEFKTGDSYFQLIQ